MADDEASQLKEQPQTEEGEEATAVEQSFENLAEETPKEQTDAPTEVPTDPGEGGQQTDAPREVPTDPGEGGQQTAEDRITDLGKEDATEKKEEIVQVFSEENPALQGKSAEQDTDRAPEEVKPEDNKHTREEAVTPDKIMPESQMSHPEIKQESAQEHLSIDLDSTATVKIVLMPSGQVVTMACTLGKTLLELKRHFASELKMSVDVIMMIFDGRAIEDTATLADLGVGPNGTVQIEIQSSDPVNNPIRSYRLHQEYQMPDVITVRVQTDEGEPKDVVVEIERTTIKKPFLGGYRHKINGIEFHNAAAQTVPLPRASSGIERYCRDTQTVEVRSRVQQTFNDTSTQMTGIGVYVSNITDKLLTPGEYTYAEEYHNNILEKIIILQKNYRRWLATRYVNKLKADKKRREEWERQQEINKQKEKENRLKQEFERRMHPKTREDFDLLYHALEKWRLEEIERINSTLTGAERKAALCMLLDQETQLLAAIDRHKIETNIDNKEQYIQDFLNKAAAPKRWRGFDGKPTEMDTPYTMRAKELRDIYNSINMKYLTQDERLDVLLTLKHTVKEHDCKLTEEIIELVDREADLLMRGVKESNLTGLRKRIATLFMQYIKTPTFNPEAANLLKVPQDPTVFRKNIYFCPSCNKYMPSTEFSLTGNTRTVGKCRTCQQIDNEARTRQESSQYRRMLRTLRRSEDAYQDGSHIAFLLQENDLRYLVENIWNGQSILSAWSDLHDMVLIRWDSHTQWSPWNCILLTEDEATAHGKLVRLDEGYGEVFMQKVKQKHTIARNYFSRLPGMAELMQKHSNNNGQPLIPGPSSLAGHALPMQSQKV
ncbi:IQ and ubiquitin-like domain-containing protein [Pomacea canaliculata]|uniref:IQ and ubiquitin-like domain-containing protein n=1 Tax=Pomacea canaliculata TaxID=400727 RepID=UPI000D72AF0F|nr:IQ and ubiquitin-like domain-containing protein [Pomacea canaliculata]